MNRIIDLVLPLILDFRGQAWEVGLRSRQRTALYQHDLLAYRPIEPARHIHNSNLQCSPNQPATIQPTNPYILHPDQPTLPRPSHNPLDRIPFSIRPSSTVPIVHHLRPPILVPIYNRLAPAASEIYHFRTLENQPAFRYELLKPGCKPLLRMPR